VELNIHYPIRRHGDANDVTFTFSVSSKTEDPTLTSTFYDSPAVAFYTNTMYKPSRCRLNVENSITITYFMQQSPSGEANRFSASREIARIL